MIDLTLIAAVLAVGGSIFAVARSYYSDNHDQSLAIERLERRLERLESLIEHREEVRELRYAALVDRLDRHRAAINDQAAFLQQKAGYHLRVNGQSSVSKG